MLLSLLPSFCRMMPILAAATGIVKAYLPARSGLIRSAVATKSYFFSISPARMPAKGTSSCSSWTFHPFMTPSSTSLS